MRARSWAWPELPVLLAVLAAAALVWLFIELADEVAGGDTHEIDQRVLDVLRDRERPGMPRGPAWLADAGRDITALGSPVVLTLVVTAAAGYDHTALQTTVRDAIAGYIDALPLGGALYLTRLYQVAYEASAGVLDVASVTVNSGSSDIAANVKQMVKAGTVAVTVA